MTAPNKAFREYATRVSFNMSLSRNQIFVLRQIALTQHSRWGTFDERVAATVELQDERKSLGMRDMFIPGMRTLVGMGLISVHPKQVEDDERCAREKAAGKSFVERKYWGPSWLLTEAGEHVVALLRIAGLAEAAAPANQNETKRRRAR